MKSIVLFTIANTLFINCAIAQQSNADNLLNWIIKKDHLNPLSYKTDVSPFYAIEGTHRDILLVKIIDDNVPITAQKKCLMDFMTPDEIQSFRNQIPQIKQIRWRKTSYKLHTNFFVSEQLPADPDNVITYHYLSLPIFLNKEHTRVIFGESFVDDIAFGRGDLILCEYKNDEWQEVARAATVNE